MSVKGIREWRGAALTSRMEQKTNKGVKQWVQESGLHGSRNAVFCMGKWARAQGVFTPH